MRLQASLSRFLFRWGNFMALSFQTQTTLVQNMAAAAQAASNTALDFSDGTVELALLEGVASQDLWLQYLILQVLVQAFLTSSSGTQVDAWLAQFPLFGGRLAGTYATGTVVFSRFTAVTSALIVPGSQVRTADGTQTFSVVTDTTNALWNTGQGGYLIPAGTASATVPVQAVTLGTGGNVAANTISQIVGAVPGIDTVNNAAAFTNGIAAESDAAVKARFQVWQENLAQGTAGAVGAAVESVQADLTYTITENETPSGTYSPGSFVVTIDDGSGATPSGTVATVANAVNAVRPIGSTAYVLAATMLAANVSITLTVAAGFSVPAAQAAVNAALVAYIGGLPVGATMPYSIIAKLAYDAYSGVQNVTSITLNGAAADLVPTQAQVVRAGVITVNP